MIYSQEYLLMLALLIIAASAVFIWLLAGGTQTLCDWLDKYDMW